MARRPALRRPPTTAPAGALRTVPVLTSRHNRRSVMRRPTTTIVDIHSRALIILRPHPHTRRRELIPHRAAAIRLRLAPIPHLAAAIAAEAAAIVAVGATGGAGGAASARERGGGVGE